MQIVLNRVLWFYGLKGFLHLLLNASPHPKAQEGGDGDVTCTVPALSCIPGS